MDEQVSSKRQSGRGDRQDLPSVFSQGALLTIEYLTKAEDIPFEDAASEKAPISDTGYPGITKTGRSCKPEEWLPGMDSNHELDRILKSHNLLILKSS